MTHAAGKSSHEPLYNVRLLAYLRHRTGKTIEVLVAETGHSKTRIAAALDGNCTNLWTLRAIVKAVHGIWEYIFKLDLPESQFYRAVASDETSGGAVKDRSRRGGAGRSKSIAA